MLRYELTQIYVLDSEGRRRGKTSKAFEIFEEKELMRAWLLDFEITNINPLRKYITPGAMFELEGQLFDLDGFKSNSGQTNCTQIKATHVSYRLNQYLLQPGYSALGTAAQIAQNLLDTAVNPVTGRAASSEFTLGAVAETGQKALDLGNDDEITVRSAFLGLQAIGVEVDFNNFLINLPVQIGEDTDKEIKFGKNLVSLDRTWTVDDGATYDVRFAPLWRIPGASQEGKINLGDRITVLDDVLGDSVNRRVVKYTKCYDKPQKDTLTLGVFIRDSATNAIDLRVSIDKRLGEKLTEGRLYNNVAINREEGFVSTSSDGQKKVTMSGTDAFAVYVLESGAVWAKKSWLDEKGLVAGAMSGTDSEVYVQIGFVSPSSADWHGIQLKRNDGQVKLSIMTIPAGSSSAVSFALGPSRKNFLFGNDSGTMLAMLGIGDEGHVECHTNQNASVVVGASGDPIQFFQGSNRFGYTGTLPSGARAICVGGIISSYTF